ncbi:hypothetical protein ACFPES_00610 [Paenibacillus sp. GCM10023248]|uniref:hypothetical protein n=1 Tax=Bacillales TaxID=1385 RepID=UPI002379C2AF|nr:MULTISPECIES: hypothetical protein [Bacillales]MDD9265522.1 hypothetical protein [Paenibacillus sp. MAHUQ-63]MDR6885432.1 hypothetical protein [Bacillus sp. 3255]
MDKKTYYVNVGTGEVLEDPSALNYEFSISATDEEIDQLQELLEEIDNSSQASYATSWYPWKVYSTETSEFNQDYDYYLTEIYRTLHRLGNDQTKQHIESMEILENGI